MTRIHGKQGGSRFAEFAKARFGMKQSVAARWSLIGEHHGQLIRDANKFAADWTAFYEFTRLAP